MQKKQRKWWQRSVMVMLSLLLVISNFAMVVGMPKKVQAADGAIQWLTYKFDMNDFSDSDQQDLFKLNGGAEWGKDDNAGKMLVTPAATSKQGSVFNIEGIQPHEDMSFSTAFSFRIGDKTPNPADGMTFAIVSDPNNLGSFGGYLGVGSTTGGVKPSIAVKFDTYLNGGAFGDPSNNYIGIALNGDVNNYSTDPEKKNWYKNLNDTGHVLHDGNTYYTWVDYNGAEQTLKVYFDSTATKPSEALITANGINLKEAFAGKDHIYAGFTASTGPSNYESHEILSWYFVNDNAPIGSNFGNPDTSDGYQQAPTSLDMAIGTALEDGSYPITVNANDVKGVSVSNVPIMLSSSQKNGTWKDENGNLITDWSTVVTDVNGYLKVFYTPHDTFVISDVKAVAVGGAIAEGRITPVVAPGGVEQTHLWLRADQGVVEDNGKVATWKDYSENELDFIQAEAANQPEFNDNSKRLNFNKAVTFNGTSSFLAKEGGVLNGQSYNNFNVFTVASMASSANSLFWEDLQGSGGRLNVHFPSGGNVYWDAGSQTNERVSTPRGTVGHLAAWNFNYGIDGAEDSGQSIYLNGKESVSSTKALTKPVTGLADKTMTLGAQSATAGFYNGQVGELIFYSKPLTEIDRKKVNSYLAIKYGISLDEIDYLAANGTQIWNADSIYNYNIAGITRDDAGSLHQKQSRSANDSTKLTIGIGTTLLSKNEEDNDRNGALTDGQALVWGSNDQALDFKEPFGTNMRHSERIWKVQNTNNVGQVTIAIPKDVVKTDNLSLLIGSDPANFTGTTPIPMTETSFDGEVYYEVQTTLDSGQYFTLATDVPVPQSVKVEEIATNQNKIVVTFDKDVDLTDGTGFTITVGEETITNATFMVDPTDATKVMITLPDGTDVTGKEVTVNYDGSGNLKGTNGVAVESFNEKISAITVTVIEPEDSTVTTGTPTFTGTATPGATVKVKISDEIELTVEADGDGNWSVTPGTTIPDGYYNVEITAEIDGKKSTTVEKNLTIDTNQYVDYAEVTAVDGISPTDVTYNKATGKFTVPTDVEAFTFKDGNKEMQATKGTNGEWTIEEVVLPTVSLATPTEATVTTGTPTFTGTATPGAKVKVKISNDLTLEVDADENGSWSVTPDTDLPNGTYNIEITAEKDGKTSTPVTKDLTIDTNQYVDYSKSNTVTEISDGVTYDDTTGKFKVPSTIREFTFKDGDKDMIATKDADGNWTITEADTSVIVIITQPEANTVTTAKPTFEGTATPGSTVTVKVSDDITLTTTADANGNWSVTPEVDLLDGNYNIEVTATKDGVTSTKDTKTLTIATVDKTQLEARVDMSTGLTESDYTPESWATYENALGEAEAILIDPKATQKEVDDAYTALKKAQDALELRDSTAGVDKSKLQTKVTDVDSLNKDTYTPESWADFEAKQSAAKAVLDNSNATQAEVDQALEDLINAEKALEKKGGLSGLTPSTGKLSPSFKNDVYNYTMNVSNSISEMDFSYGLFDANANVTMTSNGVKVTDGKALLKVGQNTIVIKVEDATGTKTYTITVNRAKASSGGGSGGGGSITPPTTETGEHIPYIKGFPDGEFKPNQNITRNQVALMIARNLGYVDGEKEVTVAPFKDVSLDYHGAGAIALVKELGIMDGDNGNFRGQENITRAQMAKVVARYMELEPKEVEITFTDTANHWSTYYIEAIREAGVIDGYEDNTFKPHNHLSRAHAVKMLNRMFNRGPLNGALKNPFSDSLENHWAFEEIVEAAVPHNYKVDQDGKEWIVK